MIDTGVKIIVDKIGIPIKFKIISPIKIGSVNLNIVKRSGVFN